MPDYAWLVQYNPLAYIIETTRYMLLKRGTNSKGIGLHFAVTVVLFLVGGIDFNRTEKGVRYGF
jgi:lipopolysaccharide transport system permease protein